jgi:hypothetical protein
MQLRWHGSCDRRKAPKGKAKAKAASNKPATSDFRQYGGTTMYELSVYSITHRLWRWEIRFGDRLLRCGTALTRVAAEMAVRDVINA